MSRRLAHLLEWYPLRLLVLAVGPWVVIWSLVMGTVGMDAGSAGISLGIVLVPTSAVALMSTRATSAEWALGRGARFSPEWNELLWHHLTRTRVARTLGVTLGVAVSVMLTGIYNAGRAAGVAWLPEEPPSFLFGGYWLLALGYVLGSVWAEARKPRRDLAHGAGAALLAPRRLGDYLDPNVAWTLGAFGIYAAGAVVVWSVALLPTTSAQVFDTEWFRVVAPVVVLLLALGGAVWAGRRTERAADDAALAYEELTRTATVNALAGASIAMLGEFAAAVVSLPRDGQQVNGWFMLVPMLITLLGVGTWIGCGTKLVFRSRRIDALRAAA